MRNFMRIFMNNVSKSIALSCVDYAYSFGLR